MPYDCRESEDGFGDNILPPPRRVNEVVEFIPATDFVDPDPFVYTGGATAMRKSVWDAMTKEQQDAHLREANKIIWQNNFPDDTIERGVDYRD